MTVLEHRVFEFAVAARGDWFYRWPECRAQMEDVVQARFLELVRHEGAIEPPHVPVEWFRAVAIRDTCSAEEPELYLELELITADTTLVESDLLVCRARVGAHLRSSD